MKESPSDFSRSKSTEAIIAESILQKSAKEERMGSQSEITTETFQFFKDMFLQHGFSEFKDVNHGYQSLGSETLIVRREDPKNILKLFLERGEYHVGFVGDDRYSNCVEWNPHTDGAKNIANAYLEGYTNLNNVVTVLGIEQRPNDDIQRLPDATQNFHGLQREGVRSFTGGINIDRTRFINLRAPGHLLPESELTEAELDRVDEYLEAKARGEKATPVMIHRSYIKPEDTLLEQAMQQKEAA